MYGLLSAHPSTHMHILPQTELLIKVSVGGSFRVSHRGRASEELSGNDWAEGLCPQPCGHIKHNVLFYLLKEHVYMDNLGDRRALLWQARRIWGTPKASSGRAAGLLTRLIRSQ